MQKSLIESALDQS